MDARIKSGHDSWVAWLRLSPPAKDASAQQAHYCAGPTCSAPSLDRDGDQSQSHSAGFAGVARSPQPVFNTSPLLAQGFNVGARCDY
jgi:hypothetical protein